MKIDRFASPVSLPAKMALYWRMANYLIDYYSETGTLFRCGRITAHDHSDAKGQAEFLALEIKPAFYKITLLLKTGNIVIYGPESTLPVPSPKPGAS